MTVPKQQGIPVTELELSLEMQAQDAWKYLTRHMTVDQKLIVLLRANNLSPRQVADCLHHTTTWVYEQLRRAQEELVSGSPELSAYAAAIHSSHKAHRYPKARKPRGKST